MLISVILFFCTILGIKTFDWYKVCGTTRQFPSLWSKSSHLSLISFLLFHHVTSLLRRLCTDESVLSQQIHNIWLIGDQTSEPDVCINNEVSTEADFKQIWIKPITVTSAAYTFIFLVDTEPIFYISRYLFNAGERSSHYNLSLKFRFSHLETFREVRIRR